MKFEVGDLAILKKSGEEAIIIKYINDDLVEVEVDNVHFPIFVDELETPYLKWFSDQRAKAQQTKMDNIAILPQQEKTDAPKGFHFSFSPLYHYDGFEDVVNQLKVYFTNQTPYSIELEYECLLNETVLFSYKQRILPYASVHLHDVAFAEMSQGPRFCCVLLQTSQKHLQNSFSETIRIKPKKLFEYISQLQKSLKPLFHVTIAKDFPALSNEIKEMPTLKKRVQKIMEPTAQKTKYIPEIDLHLENIAAHVHGLNNFEILTLQLNALEDALDQAIGAHQQSMIIIHGVGKGKLKEEVHAVLRDNFSVDFFIHDWMPRYGYGATEVFFK